MDASALSVLVVGATGKVGSELVSLLVADGIKPRLFQRASSQNAFKDTDLEVVSGELADKESLKAALEGINTVFMITRDQPDQALLEGNLIDVAVEQGVEKIIKSSAFAASLDPPQGYGAIHHQTELKLMRSGVKWVILRPYFFMQNFLELSKEIAQSGFLPLPLAKAKVGVIDARDVALVAFRVIKSHRFDNQCHELTGPESLTMKDCSDALGQVLNKKVRYFSPPYWLASLMMRRQGVSPWDIRMRRQLFRMIKSGGEEKLTSCVKQITGKEPYSFADFVKVYQADFH